MMNYKEVAQYLIWLAGRDSKQLTLQQLQHIMYLCQGWSYAKDNRSLFEKNLFTAKEDGPAINELDAWLHHYRHKPIPKKFGVKYDNSDIDFYWGIFSKYPTILINSLCQDKVWSAHYGAPFHIENTILPDSEIKKYYTDHFLGEDPCAY